MNVILMENLNSMFTSFVMEFIHKGYSINCNTMGGSYSREICHVDLSNKDSDKIVRVWMLYHYGNHFTNEFDTIEIVAKAYSKRSSDMWTNGGETLKSVTAYIINEHAGVYSFSLDDVKEVQKIRSVRWKSHQDIQDLNQTEYSKVVDLEKVPKSLQDSIVKRIQSIRGFKRATFKHVKEIKLNRRNGNRSFQALVSWELNGKSDYMVLQ